jgi:hypothetical protein
VLRLFSAATIYRYDSAATERKAANGARECPSRYLNTKEVIHDEVEMQITSFCLGERGVAVAPLYFTEGKLSEENKTELRALPGNDDEWIVVDVDGFVVARVSHRMLGMTGAEGYAKLFAAAPKLQHAAQSFYDAAPSIGTRCLFCEAAVYGNDDYAQHSPECEMSIADVAIAKSKGEL